MKTLFVTLLVLFAAILPAHAQQVPSSQDYMQAAQDALQGNDYTTAIQDYLLAINKDPKNWEAYQNLGGCYIQLRKMDDAKAAYDQSLRINPNNPALAKFVSQVWGGKTAPVPTAVMPVATPTVQVVIPLPTVWVASPTPVYVYTVVPTPTVGYVYTVVPTPISRPLSAGTPTPVPVYIPPVDMTNQVLDKSKAQTEMLRPPFAGLKPYYFQALPRYNLPEKDTVTFDFGGALWFGGVQNFNDYFGADQVTPATSHTGWEADLGADYTFANEFQVGLQVEGIISPVVRSQVNNQTVEWDSYALGLALSTKYLIALNSMMSMAFHLEGGYYTLVGSQITYNEGEAGTLGLSGSTFGFMPEIQMEFFQVADKSLAFDFGLGYRFLNFTNLTGNGTVNGTVISGALPNVNGSPAYDDYSGPRVSLSIRFVH